jgi:3',5'-cyclic AMP phosphodiesterase CpdA
VALDLLIVQVSDIHVGPEFQEEIFNQAVNEINKLNVDVLLVTGDLTENGLLSEFERASKVMERFSCKSRIYTSGNHDYRNTGYLLFKRFFPSKSVFEAKELIIIVLSTARPERNDGEAGHRQIIWFEHVLKRKKKFKLVMMHHHLVPVPDTGPNTIPILDAGDVLRSIERSKVNLVLCGHRHRPWEWRINNTPIVHAGSLSSERLRGFFANSYNIIKVGKDGYEASLKIVGGPKIDFNKIIAGESALTHIPFINRNARK